MNQPLPFSDESYDLVISAEGVEHLENPWLAFREFARVLRTPGILIVTTPNYSNIERRVAYLLKGAASRPPETENTGNSAIHLDPPHLSIFPICTWKMAGEKSGLHLDSLDTFSPRAKQFFYWPLALFVDLCSHLASRRTRQRYAMDWTQGLKVLMGGRSLVLVFKKVR